MNYSFQTASEDSALEVRRCREVKSKLSLLSQKLRVLINVCHVYSTRLERALDGEGSALSLGNIAEVEEEEDREGGSIMPTLSNEVRIPK